MSDILANIERLVMVERALDSRQKSADLARESGDRARIAEAMATLRKQQETVEAARAAIPPVLTEAMFWAFRRVAENNVDRQRVTDAIEKNRRLLDAEMAKVEEEKKKAAWKYTAKRVTPVEVKDPIAVTALKAQIASHESALADLEKEILGLSRMVNEEIASIQVRRDLREWRKRGYSDPTPLCYDQFGERCDQEAATELRLAVLDTTRERSVVTPVAETWGEEVISVGRLLPVGTPMSRQEPEEEEAVAEAPVRRRKQIKLVVPGETVVQRRMRFLFAPILKKRQCV